MQISNQATKRLPRILGLIALLICIPLTVRADAGTPLMWAGMLHMVFGNAIIGIFEGLILAWIFKLRKGICVLVMIPANYFSAWIGGLYLNHEISDDFAPIRLRFATTATRQSFGIDLW